MTDPTKLSPTDLDAEIAAVSAQFPGRDEQLLTRLLTEKTRRRNADRGPRRLTVEEKAIKAERARARRAR